jgi:hypothetical protein
MGTGSLADLAQECFVLLKMHLAMGSQEAAVASGSAQHRRVGKAKRAHHFNVALRIRWARRNSAFVHPTLAGLLRRNAPRNDGERPRREAPLGEPVTLSEMGCEEFPGLARSSRRRRPILLIMNAVCEPANNAGYSDNGEKITHGRDGKELECPT